MKAIIRLTNLSNSTAVLKTLDEVINSDASLQKQVIENGVLFAELSPEEVKTLSEQLTKVKYSAYKTMDNSVRLSMDGYSISELIKILFMLLGQEGGLAKMLWTKGLTLETATVDQAKELKKLLEDGGAEVIIAATSQFQFVVSGRVRRTDNMPFGDSGYTIQAFDQAGNNNAVSLGAPVALHANGAYSISYEWESTGDRKVPNLIVRLLNPQNQIVAENSRQAASREETLDLEINVQDPLLEPKPVDKTFVVHGTIHLVDGSTLPGIMVRAFDRDMRSEEQLGEIVTDTQGFYEISYTRNQFQRAEKERADLLIRVMDVHGKEIGVSETIFNAEPLQNLDLTLKQDQYRGLSEYERYVKELTPIINNVNLAELTAHDITFLIGETNILTEHLQYLQMDTHWGKEHNIEQAVFYGLFRQGLSTSYRGLLAEKPVRLLDALKQSLAQNVIPAVLAHNLDSIIDNLKELAVEISFVADDEAAVPPLGVMLGTASALTEAQQRQFVRFTLQYESTGKDDFWELARTELGDDAAVRAVQLNLQSSALTINHLPVLKQVQIELKEPSVKALAAWSEADWLGVVERAAAHGEPLPSSYNSAKEYVGAIVKNVDTYLPSERLFARAKRTSEDLQVEADSPLFNLYAHLGLSDTFEDPNLGQAAKEKQIRKKIQQFDSFQQNNPALDLRYADLLRGRFYAQGEPLEIDWGNISIDDQPEMLKQARAFQRMMPLAPDTESRLSLLSAGYDNSYTIAGTSPERLISGTGMPRELIDKVLKAAGDQLVRTENVRVGIDQIVSGIRLRVDNTEPTVAESFMDLSDIAQLFGSQGFCDCPHCNSVLSQSAYFVDLMTFVEEHVSQNESVFGLEGDPRRHSALYLPERRPDLWHLPLSCENIHTQVPYLEVVNHIFEEFLIGHLGARDRNLLNPRNRDGMYRYLAGQRSTFSQPFLPARDELRLYLSHFRLIQADIYRVLGREASDYRLAYLQVAPVEFEIISEADPNTASIGQLYGLAGRAPLWIAMSEFMTATGLSRKEVTQVLNAEFLHGHTLYIEKEIVEGSLGQQFEEKMKGHNDTHAIAELDLIHRSVRLWRKTDWTFAEFDFVLGRMNEVGLATGIDGAAVYGVANLKILQDRLKLNVEELVSLFDLVPNPSSNTPFFKEKSSLYYRLFGDEPFAADLFSFDNLETEQPTVELLYPDAYRLLAGLSLSEPDLMELLIQLRRDLNTTGTSAERTIENISLLYRHALLARKLRRSPSELFTLIRLIFGAGCTALTSLNEIFQLTDTVNEIKDLPFSLAELSRLVLDEGRDTSRRLMTEEQFEDFRMQLPEMEEENLYFTLSNVYGWKREVSEPEVTETVPEAWIVLALAGITLATLQEAATLSDDALLDLLESLEKWHLLGETLKLEVEHLRFIQENPTLFGNTTAISLSLISVCL